MVSLFLESMAKYYLPELHLPGATLYARAVFWLMMVAFIFIGILNGQYVPKLAFFTGIVFLSYSMFGTLVGVAKGAAMIGVISHLGHNLGSMVIICSTSMITFPESVKSRRMLEIFAILILAVSAIIVFGTLLQISSVSHLSLTLSALALPFVVALSNKSPLMFLLSVLLIVLTIKRGLWVAAFALLALVSPKKAILTILALAVIFATFLLFFSEDNAIYQILILKLSGDEISSIDALTSGRLGIFSSLHFALTESNSFLTGLGFGSTFDANINSSTSDMAWVTNGVDVSFGHFWFLYGYFWGSLFFLFYSFIALVPLLWARFSGDYLLIILSRISLFIYISSLSSFIAWDPLQWAVIGLTFARKTQLLKTSNGAVNLWLKGKG